MTPEELRDIFRKLESLKAVVSGQDKVELFAAQRVVERLTLLALRERAKAAMYDVQRKVT